MISNYWCQAEIRDGHLHLKESLAFKAAMRRMRPGAVVVRVERPATKRTLDQNAYLHAVPFPILAEYFGDSVEGVKYDLMGEKWGWQPSKQDPTRMVPMKPSTSSMTIEECTEFIEWLIPWAATEHGVLIPLPNEYTYDKKATA